MSDKVHHPGSARALENRRGTPPGNSRNFFCILGGNLIVPALASHGLDSGGMAGRLGGSAVFLCLAGLMLQGLAFGLGRLRRAVPRDQDRPSDLESWRRLADRGAFVALLSRFSMFLAGWLLAAAVLLCVAALLWPVVVGTAAP